MARRLAAVTAALVLALASAGCPQRGTAPEPHSTYTPILQEDDPCGPATP